MYLHVGQSDPDLLLSSLIIAHDQHEQVKETDCKEEVGKKIHVHVHHTHVLYMYCTREGVRNEEIKQFESHTVILSIYHLVTRNEIVYCIDKTTCTCLSF